MENGQSPVEGVSEIRHGRVCSLSDSVLKSGGLSLSIEGRQPAMTS